MGSADTNISLGACRLCFLSMLIVYGKKYLALHLVSGIVAFSLVLGRIVWGFTGTKYVRFGAFLKGFSEAKKEFSLIKEDADHTVGHPAVAGWVMLLLIASAFGVGISGIWLLEFAAKEQKEIALQVHEAFANTVLAIAFIHLQWGNAPYIFTQRWDSKGDD